MTAHLTVIAIMNIRGLPLDSLSNSGGRRRISACFIIGLMTLQEIPNQTFGTGSTDDAYAIAILGVVNAHHSRTEFVMSVFCSVNKNDLTRAGALRFCE